MEIFDSKSEKELLQSIIAEIAKASNEIRCAKADIDKAQSRIKFCVMIANKLIEREGDPNGTIKISN
jgi:hypothetical protein